MDEGEAGAASSSGAAGETELQDASAAGEPEQQEQVQLNLQQQQGQQLVTPIAGARNYGYPDDFMMYAFKVGPHCAYPWWCCRRAQPVVKHSS
jgi:hypothetical protein